MLSSFLLSTARTFSRWVRAGLRSARLCWTRRVSSLGQAGRRHQEVVDRLAALHERPEQHPGVTHQGDEVGVALVEHVRDPLEVAQQLVDLLVPRRDVGGQRGHAVEGPAELLRGVAGEVGEGGQPLRQLVGVDPLGGLGEAGERLDDVVRRLGPLDGDLALLLHLPRTGREQREVHGAEQRLDLDGRRGLGAELLAAVDPEGDRARGRRPARRTPPCRRGHRRSGPRRWP